MKQGEAKTLQKNDMYKHKDVMKAHIIFLFLILIFQIILYRPFKDILVVNSIQFSINIFLYILSFRALSKHMYAALNLYCFVLFAALSINAYITCKMFISSLIQINFLPLSIIILLIYVINFIWSFYYLNSKGKGSKNKSSKIGFSFVTGPTIIIYMMIPKAIRANVIGIIGIFTMLLMGIWFEYISVHYLLEARAGTMQKNKR